MDSINGVRLDPRDQSELTAQILERAIAEVGKNGSKTDVKIGPYPADDETLRDGLEATYRQLAGTETDEQRRYALVDKANAVRRWTLR
jgi:serine/threonine-protein kinase PknG